MVSIDSKVDYKGTFQLPKKTCRPKVGTKTREVSKQNRFILLREDVQTDPSSILVCDSLIRHQTHVFCSMGARSKFSFSGPNWMMF